MAYRMSQRLDNFVTRTGEQRLMVVADVEDVLRGLGAFDEKWCVEHEASVIPNWHVESCGADDPGLCRVVPVLVWKLP